MTNQKRDIISVLVSVTPTELQLLRMLRPEESHRGGRLTLDLGRFQLTEFADALDEAIDELTTEPPCHEKGRLSRSSYATADSLLAELVDGPIDKKGI